MINFIKQLNHRPIAFYPIYRQLAQGLSGGILLSQPMYWFSHKDKIYKTDADIILETSLTHGELRQAKQRIKKLSFISVTKEGVPCKTYYEINWDAYVEAVVSAYCINNKAAKLIGSGKEKEHNQKTYLMVDGNGYYKIGKSFYPDARESTLQAENPTIELIAVCDVDVEEKLHFEYSQNRKRGEWFCLNKSQVSEIIKKYKFKHKRLS